MRLLPALLILLLPATAARAQALLPIPPGAWAPQRHTLPAPPPAWSYVQLGLFCKLDVQLERRLGIPVFIRLGDARQVEALEGKGPLALPPPNPER